jgi:hypothetical protein
VVEFDWINFCDVATNPPTTPQPLVINFQVANHPRSDHEHQEHPEHGPMEQRTPKSRGGQKGAVKDAGKPPSQQIGSHESGKELGNNRDLTISKPKTSIADKTTFKPLTTKQVPRGCLDSLKYVEEQGVLDDIEEQFKSPEEGIEERSDQDTYIVTLLKGLDTLTDKAVTPLEEILSDARIDTDKTKYVEKVENCYRNGSILNKLLQFLDLIQTKTGTTPEIEGLATKIMQLLVDINPSKAEDISKNDSQGVIFPAGARALPAGNP